MSLRPFPETTPVHRAAHPAPSTWSPASSTASGTWSGTPGGSRRLGTGSLTLAPASPGVAEAQALFSPIRGAAPGVAACVGAGLGLTFSGREKASRMLPSASGPRVPVGYRPGSVSGPSAPGMASASGTFGAGASASSRDAADFSAGLAGAGSGGTDGDGTAGADSEDEAGWIVSSGFGRTPSTALGLLVDLVPEGRRAVGGTSVVAPYLHEVLPRLVTDLIPDVPRTGAKAKRLGTPPPPHTHTFSPSSRKE